MKTNPPNNYSLRGDRSSVSRQQRGMQRDHDYLDLSDITLGMILRKLLQGLFQIWIALKYQFHRRTAGIFTRIHWSWYKAGLVVLAIFILTKKDIQFSINMKAPGGTVAQQEKAVRPVSIKEERLDLSNAFRLGSGVTVTSVGDLDPEATKAYVRRFTKVAQVEMQKFGIPASVNMAQAILESQAGTTEVVRGQNNHFGLKMKGQQYQSAWESWRAHSILLRNDFPELFELGTAYRKWANGLQKAKYLSDRNYSDKLMEVIEQYQLYLLDEQ